MISVPRPAMFVAMVTAPARGIVGPAGHQERERCRQIALTDTWERSAAAWLDVIEKESPSQ